MEKKVFLFLIFRTHFPWPSDGHCKKVFHLFQLNQKQKFSLKDTFNNFVITVEMNESKAFRFILSKALIHH